MRHTVVRNRRRRRMPLFRYKVLLLASILLIITGFILTGFALFSPQWQILEIPQGYQTHQHGIWWDCIVSTQADERIIPLDQVDQENNGETCISKFEPSTAGVLRTALDNGDSVSKELVLHRFLPHHKAVIFFTVFVFIFGVISTVIGACSPCFPPNSIMYIVATFMTCACSILADVLFILGNSRPADISIEVKFKIGFACYVHILASTIFGFSLIFSVVASYLLIATKGVTDGCCTSKNDYLEQQRWRSTIERSTCDRKHCRPFVVVDDDSSV